VKDGSVGEETLFLRTRLDANDYEEALCTIRIAAAEEEEEEEVKIGSTWEEFCFHIELPRMTKKRLCLMRYA